MAKKSAAPRHSKAAQRPTSTAKPASVRLVRPQGTTSAADQQHEHASGAHLVRPGAATATAPRAAASGTATLERPAPARVAPARVAPPVSKAPAAKPVAPKPAPIAKAPAANTAAPKPAAAKPAPVAATAPRAAQPAAPARVSETRIQRATATRARRVESIVTPEHYGYVLKDLRLTFALALIMFTVIVVLHFVLPS